MDIRTGDIAQLSEFERRLTTDELVRHIRPIDEANLSPKVRAALRETGRAQISRNSPCPCGSRKRFKRCCMKAD